MTAETHKAFAVSGALGATIYMQATGNLPVNYYVGMAIVLMTAKYGALFPDVDHAWDNVKEKNAVNFVLNKAIHITGGKHRSWQTHSLDIALLFSVICYFGPQLLYKYNYLNEVNSKLLFMLAMGFSIGWLSHIVADLITPAGVRIFAAVPKTSVALVPKKFLMLSFSTGDLWEDIVYKACRLTNLAVGAIAILYPTDLLRKIF